MASPSNFVARPNKRIAAFIYDFFAIVFLFLVVSAAGELTGHDWGQSEVFLACAMAYHGWFLAFRDGRTLGKAAQDICVVAADGRPLHTWQAAVRVCTRFAPLFLLSIPIIDWVWTDALVGLGIKITCAILWLGEYFSLTQGPLHRTLADRVARTLVVNTPTWEPHRAPAIPMFSANDAEFGDPPRRPRA